MDFRSLVLLAVAIVVPLTLIVMRRDRALLAWICVVVCIDIFSPTVVVNWSAARIAGLFLLPRAVLFLRLSLRTWAGRALLVQYLWLLCLGLIFGFIVPWDDGFVRPVTQAAQGRVVVQLVRLASDLSITLFVARWVTRTKRPDIVVKYLLWGVGITSVFALLQFVTRVDFYLAITGLRELSAVSSGRMRGLNYEPRGLGLIVGTGLLLLFIWWSSVRRGPRLLLIGSVFFAAMALAMSASALFVLFAGSAVLLLWERQTRKWVLLVTAGILLAASLLWIIPLPQFVSDYAASVNARLSTEKYYMVPSNPLEDFALRLESFDTAALLFLIDNPQYIVTGTGPGLISIPATWYMPLGPRTFYTEATRTPMVALPTMGAILELSNGGVLMLFLWLLFVVDSLLSFRYLVRIRGQQGRIWQVGRAAFLVGAAIYIVQASPLSLIWPVLVGIGLSAPIVAPRVRRTRSNSQCALSLAQATTENQVTQGLT